MKIALYTGMFKRNQDGVARSLHRLVRSMLKHGHDVFVGSPALSYIEHPNLTFYTVKSFPLFFYPEYKVAIPDFRYIQAILEYRPDILHISTPDFMGMTLMFFAKRARIPTVFIHHSDVVRTFNYFGLGFLHGPVNAMLQYNYNQAIATYVPTEFYKTELHELGIKRVGIWGRGVDHVSFNHKLRSKTTRDQWGITSQKVIIYAGRFVWNKRLDVFIKVYRRFQNSNPNAAKFIMIGKGPIQEKLEKLIPKAIFTGFLEGQELGSALASGDIFLFPSDTDTFGQVVQEAITSGMPAIVSDVGGCQEIVTTAKSGFVVENGNVEQFYQRCLQLIKDPYLLAKMRENGIQFGKTKSWDSINRPLIIQYQRIAEYWTKKKGYLRFKKFTDMYRINLLLLDEGAKRVRKNRVKGRS